MSGTNDIIRPNTISLDTKFLVGIADSNPAYDEIAKLVSEHRLLPVVSRHQIEEMACRKGATRNRAIGLLAALGAPIFELPPFYYIMEAEVYAQTVGRTISRSGIIGRTQWEATTNLMTQLPPTVRNVGCPVHVADESLADTIARSNPLSESPFEAWQCRIKEARSKEEEKSPARNRRMIIEWFAEADMQLKEKLWELPSVDTLCEKVDLSHCPSLCCHFNHFAALCKSRKALTYNDFVDAARVSIAPYVDIFTCDHEVKDLLRQGKFIQAGGNPCSSPEEVVGALEFGAHDT